MNKHKQSSYSQVSLLIQVLLSTQNIFITSMALSDLHLCIFTIPFTLLDILKIWHIEETFTMVIEVSEQGYFVICSKGRKGYFYHIYLVQASGDSNKWGEFPML